MKKTKCASSACAVDRARTLPAVADRWLALARANPEGQAGLFGPGPDPIDELAQIVRSVTSST